MLVCLHHALTHFQMVGIFLVQEDYLTPHPRRYYLRIDEPPKLGISNYR